MHPDIYASLECITRTLGVTLRYRSPSCFQLEVPYCLQKCLWELGFACVGCQHVPDFNFSPHDDFFPLIMPEPPGQAAASSKALSQCLAAWDSTDPMMLTRVVQALLSRRVQLQSCTQGIW